MNRRNLFQLLGLGAAASVVPAAALAVPKPRGTTSAQLRALTEKLNADPSLRDMVEARRKYVLHISHDNGAYRLEEDYFPTFEAAREHLEMRKRIVAGRIRFAIYGPT